MKRVIAVIQSEAGNKFELLKLSDDPELTTELLELIALHEQLTGTPPKAIDEMQVQSIVRRNLGISQIA